MGRYTHHSEGHSSLQCEHRCMLGGEITANQSLDHNQSAVRLSFATFAAVDVFAIVTVTTAVTLVSAHTRQALAPSLLVTRLRLSS